MHLKDLERELLHVQAFALIIMISAYNQVILKEEYFFLLFLGLGACASEQVGAGDGGEAGRAPGGTQLFPVPGNCPRMA